jgi:hypothetical protein
MVPWKHLIVAFMHVYIYIYIYIYIYCLFLLTYWPRGLRRRSVAARLLRSWVRTPLGAWIFVCCDCCVLSVRGLCDELITRSKESYRLWRVVVCDLEISKMSRPWTALGRSVTKKREKERFCNMLIMIKSNLRMLCNFTWNSVLE